MSKGAATLLSVIVVGALLGYWVGGFWGGVIAPAASVILLTLLARSSQ